VLSVSGAPPAPGPAEATTTARPGTRRRRRRLAGRRRALVRRWPQPGVRTDGFVLRVLRRRDRHDLLASIDGSARRWLGYDDRVVRRLQRLLRYYLVWRMLGALQVRRLVVERDGRVVGCYALWPAGAKGAHVSVNWWLAPHARGRALGRASLRAVLEHVHVDLGAPVARLCVHDDNIRAIRQIVSVGARFVEETDQRLPDGRLVRIRCYHHRAP
jgi:RimJ/RimL family protein N-acetyltransferase